MLDPLALGTDRPHADDGAGLIGEQLAHRGAERDLDRRLLQRSAQEPRDDSGAERQRVGPIVLPALELEQRLAAADLDDPLIGDADREVRAPAQPLLPIAELAAVDRRVGQVAPDAEGAVGPPSGSRSGRGSRSS